MDIALETFQKAAGLDPADSNKADLKRTGLDGESAAPTAPSTPLAASELPPILAGESLKVMMKIADNLKPSEKITKLKKERQQEIRKKEDEKELREKELREKEVLDINRLDMV